MYYFKHKIWIALAVVIIMLAGCKKWEDHIAVDNTQLKENLLDAIKANNNTSRFYELLKQTGYDSLLMQTKTYTVWAPDNNALANIDAAVLNDAAKLRLFVGNHISNQSYLTSAALSPIRIKMLNGKNNTFYDKSFDEAAITLADQYFNNGILHIINKPVYALPNLWEYITTVQSDGQQKTAITDLNIEIFDSTTATQIGVDPNTGAPIYQPGTGLVTGNNFNNRVYNTQREDSLYTYFVLSESAYTAEKDKLLPYFATGTSDSTSDLANYHLIKDLLVRGVYTQDQLPDTLISKFGVKIPIEKSSIVSSYKVSNGIVHVMNSMNFQIQDKVPSFIIQGENPRGFSHDRRSNIFYRIRTNPNTGASFNDIVAQNHSTALFNIMYSVNNVYSVKYKIYWVAVNDFSTATHQQRLLMDLPTNTIFPYVTVPLANYSEVYLGEYTYAQFRQSINMYLVSANSTNNALNPLTLDYIRMEPVYY